MSNICIIPFIGLPATGKTTSAFHITDYFCENLYLNVTCFHICYDYFLKQQPFSEFKEVFYENQKYKQFRVLMLELISALLEDLNQNEDFRKINKFIITKNLRFSNDLKLCVNNKDQLYVILIDDNNYYRSMRYEFYKLSKQYRTGYFQMSFQFSQSFSLMQNSNRYKFENIPEEIIKIMSFRIEYPTDKNHWEKFTYKLIKENSNLDFKKFLQFIHDRCKNFEHPFEDKTIDATPISIYHEIDLILRKYISQQMKLDSKNDPKKFAGELNMKRKQLLKDIKNKIINIPENLDQIINFF